MRDVNAINAQAIAGYLVYLIGQDEESWSDNGDIPTVRSFEEAGVMTRNAGLTPIGISEPGSIVRRAPPNSGPFLGLFPS